MDIKQLKKELSLTNANIAEFFGLIPISYANSSAKKRYENALCNFYDFVKRNAIEQNKTKQTDTVD